MVRQHDELPAVTIKDWTQCHWNLQTGIGKRMS